jgi:hypothetical protein
MTIFRKIIRVPICANGSRVCWLGQAIGQAGQRFSYETRRFTMNFRPGLSAADFHAIRNRLLAQQDSTATQPIVLCCNPRLMVRGGSGDYDTAYLAATWVGVARWVISIGR